MVDKQMEIDNKLWLSNDIAVTGEGAFVGLIHSVIKQLSNNFITSAFFYLSYSYKGMK